MKRHKSGQRLGHGDANRYEHVYDWWRRNKAYGEGGSESLSPVNFSKVMAANYTGQQIYIGDVCEFDGNPFADFDPAEQYPDPRNDRWLKAVVPNGERIGWGIALDPIIAATGDDREGGWFLTLGVCHAIVKIEDENHSYAAREAGETVLKSQAAKGPVKILHRPTGGSLPERRLCLVQLMDESGDIVDMIEVNDTGKSAGELTFPTAERSYAHRGKIRRYTSTGVTFENAGDCWLLLTDEWGEVAGDVPAVNHQYYGPAKYVGLNDFDGEELPTYTYCRSELPTEIVEVSHSGVTNGDVVEPVSEGNYHPGRIRRRQSDGSYADGGEIWIQFVTAFANYGAVAGDVLAVQGQWYGPARYSDTWDRVQNEGEEDESHDKRAVYVCENFETSFLGEFEDNITSGSSAGTFKIFHSRTLANSGFTKEVITWGSDATAGKKGAIQYVAGRWVGSQTGC